MSRSLDSKAVPPTNAEVPPTAGALLVRRGWPQVVSTAAVARPTDLRRPGNIPNRVDL